MHTTNNEDGMDNEERYLREAIALLQREYERAAKPYFDRLAAIKSIRTPMIYVDRSTACELLPANPSANLDDAVPEGDQGE